MPTAYLRSRLEERAQIADLMTGVLDKAAEAKRDVTDDEKKLLDKWEARASSLDDEIKRLETVERGNQKLPGRRRPGLHGRRAGGASHRGRPKNDAPNRRSARASVSGSSSPRRSSRTRAAARWTRSSSRASSSSAPRSPPPTLDIPPVLWDGPSRYVTTTPLLDVIGRERVSSGSIEYISWGDSDPQAGGPIAEGDLKPEAAVTATTVPLSLGTYAHWKAITRQALEDFPRIQSIVEGKLRGGLANKLEAVAAGVLLAATLPPVVNTDLLAGIRQGIGLVQAAGYQPNAVVLNPADYATLDIAAAAQAGNGPVMFGQFWGVRPVPAAAIPVGSVYVGDFTEGSDLVRPEHHRGVHDRLARGLLRPQPARHPRRAARRVRDHRVQRTREGHQDRRRR